MSKKAIFSTLTITLIVLILGFIMLKPFFYFFFLQLLLPDQTPHLAVNSLKKMDKDAVVLLDTRSYEEYEISHIQGARWVGFDAFNVSKVGNLPKDTTIVLYCSIGYRSSLVGKKLKDAGYREVYNLWGGIFAWVNQGQPIYVNNYPTNQIHPYSPAWGFWLRRGDKTYSNTQKKAPH